LPEMKTDDSLLNQLPPPKAEKKGFFSKLFSKKEKVEKIDMMKSFDLPTPPAATEEKVDLAPLGDDTFAPPGMTPAVNPTIEPKPVEAKQEEVEEPEWAKEGEEYDRDSELLEEGEHFREQEMLEEGEKYLEESKTPLNTVMGIGAVREKKLRKAGIKTAEHLAKHDFKKFAKKLKIPHMHAKKLILNAQKVTRLKEKLKSTKIPKKEKGISDVIKELEEEKRTIDHLKKKDMLNEDKIIELEGHKDLINVLEALEKKRNELTKQEELLATKELKLSQHDDTYKRDVNQIENLRRRLDHDIRERTQYLINMEKEYFQKAQTLAKKQSDIEVKEKGIVEKEDLFKQKETHLKMKSNELEDRSITIETKEKKYEKIMRDLERQDVLLKEKEDDLLKRESEYMRKLSTLETHEKLILRELEERRKKLESKEKEIEMKERTLRTKEKTVDKKSIAAEYAQNILEQEKGKLVDDEFEQYLHEQLGVLKGSGINVDDINFAKSVSMPNFSNTNKSIYQLIDTCRDLVKSDRVTEAKVFYNQLREKYYGMSFNNPKEKEAIHNMIRTLYDEINLAEIGTNR